MAIGFSGEVKLKLLLGVASAVSEREIKRERQPFTIANQVIEARADELTARLREEIFSGGIGVADAMVAPQQQHRC